MKQKSLNNQVPELLTTKEVCRILGIHQDTLRKWEREKKIIPYRVGVRKDRRYLREDILKLIEPDTS